MTDGQYRYEALQTCALTVKSIDGNTTVCEIQRAENRKSINGSSDPLPLLPEYLRLYLTTWGSCTERATGTYDPLTGVLLLRGEEPVVVVHSWVQWSPHAYALVVGGDGMRGLAFDLDVGGDRVSEVGVVVVESGVS